MVRPNQGRKAREIGAESEEGGGHRKSGQFLEERIGKESGGEPKGGVGFSTSSMQMLGCPTGKGVHAE